MLWHFGRTFANMTVGEIYCMKCNTMIARLSMVEAEEVRAHSTAATRV